MRQLLRQCFLLAYNAHSFTDYFTFSAKILSRATRYIGSDLGYQEVRADAVQRHRGMYVQYCTMQPWQLISCTDTTSVPYPYLVSYQLCS